jgi:hypothetical protein
MTAIFWLSVLSGWCVLRGTIGAVSNVATATLLWTAIGLGGLLVAVWCARRGIQLLSFAGLANRPREARDAAGLPVVLDGQTEQSLQRGRDAAGAAWLTGQVRVVMPAGQRTSHAHVAICPPLARAPQVDVEQIAGPSAEVSVGMTLPQGIRLDVKRSGSAAEEAVIVLEFYGSEAV